MKILSILMKNLFCKVLYRVSYINIDVLNKVDNCLICPNHSRMFDPFYVLPAELENEVHIMAKSELFNNFFYRWLFKKYNVFPIDREHIDVRSLLKSLNIFKENKKAKLLIFPEGRVVKNDSEIKKHYKKGAVYIAANSNVPIIPVYITRRPRLFQKIEVIYGEPIYIRNEDISDKRKLKEYSIKLIENIYNLNENNLIEC